MADKPDVVITFAIPAKIYSHLKEHLSPMMKPAKRDPVSGVVMAEPMFNSADPIAEWLKQIASVNIMEVLRAKQNPPAQLAQLQQAVADAHDNLIGFCSPSVSSSEITNSTL